MTGFGDSHPARTVDDELHQLDAYFRAANYLTAGQIYLMDNALLHRPLIAEDVKPRLLGHWGTSPGLNFLYAHLSRSIKARDLNAIFVCGPGHGGPAIIANTWLEGTYSERFPHVGRDGAGMARLFRQFSFPGGIPSHCSPETPGSIHEGGELGYALSHAFGAAFDNPELVVACVVGDGEAETGPAAAGWHSNKFLDPRRDGVVLPILHLNGYKIAAPTVLARIPTPELLALFTGYGYRPILVEGGFGGEEPMAVHRRMAAALEGAFAQIAEIQELARSHGFRGRPEWPMLILKTPKGWTGPKMVDGLPVEGTFRSHQLPLAGVRTNPEHLAQLEAWLRSYRPDELFDQRGRPLRVINDFPPSGQRRMSDNPHANGGLLLTDLELPDFCDYGVPVPNPGTVMREGTHVLGDYFRDAIRANPSTFRLFGPDETSSNRLQDVFEVTDRTWDAELRPGDDHLAADGRVMETLSEHQCEGWLEGIPSQWPSWALQLLRGLHPYHRLDVQSAREVVKGER